MVEGLKFSDLNGKNCSTSQGLVTVPFWEYWTSPKKVAMALTIYRSWLGDVKNGDISHDPC